MRVAIVGATGLVGKALVDRLLSLGHTPVALVRNLESAQDALPNCELFSWDPATAALPLAAIADCDGLVNLAGEPVAQRWNEDAKKRIYDSRINVTTLQSEALLELGEIAKEMVFVSGSATGIYGDHNDATVDETSALGNDWLANLANDWEQAAYASKAAGARVVTIRTGLVLAWSGGALPAMAKPVKAFAGSWLGNGKQWVPWIHLDDEVGIIVHALENREVTGPINACSPNPVTNKQLMKALGKELKRPVLAGAPAPVIKLALGEQSQLVLDSCRALPTAAQNFGYLFKYEQIAEALSN